ncbi:MAG: M16 family metallopeptidase [Sphingomonadales bacterium]
MQLTVLPNGLRVASREMAGIETAAVGLYADVGSRHEPESLSGLAHLFEHMVFKGAGGRSARDISETIEDVGGDLNAATDRESTTFMASVLAEHVGLGIELIADMILRPHFKPAELEREKQVVLQELGEARDTPSDIIFDDLQSVAFADQPLGRSVLGAEESIAAVSADDLNAWRRDHYRAGSLSLVAAGKLNHAQLVELAEEWLGELPAGTAPPLGPAHFTGGDRVGRSASDQAHLALGFAGPAQLAGDYYAGRLFADALGGGMSSRLFQQLREERGLAYSIYAALFAYRDAGMLSIYAATAPQQSAAAAQLIEEVLADCAKNVSQREVDRVRTQAKAGLLMSMESPWGQAHYVARQLSLHDRLVEPAEVIAELEKVTVDDVQDAGRAMLAGPRARATIGFPAVRAA